MSKVVNFFFVSGTTPAGNLSGGAGRIVERLTAEYPGCYIQQLRDEKAIRLYIAELLVESTVLTVLSLQRHETEVGAYMAWYHHLRFVPADGYWPG